MGFSLLADLLVPQLCLLCGASLLANRPEAPWEGLPICPRCLSTFTPLSGERCRVCGLPLISEIGLCTRCRTRDYPFCRHRSLFEYRDGVKELIGQYKFHDQRALARLFAFWLTTLLRAEFAGLPVVPVPARPRTLRRRGWDHVGEVARCLHRHHGVTVLPLLRRHGGASQKSLDFAHRLTNLRGQIQWRPRGCPGGPPPCEAVLLDDVFTTGATASECTRVLQAHGVGRVEVVTLAAD